MIPGPPERGDRRVRNRLHWDRTLDARNLRESGTAASVECELELYRSADVRMALAAMRPLGGRMVLDLGGGLGLMAILLAREGAEVVVADVSLRRLKAARELALQAGAADRIRFVQAEAEALPFLDGSLQRQTTKSVLIHTRLGPAAEELARTLSPGDGVAVLVEPMDRNPLANAYRRLLAPRIWQEITDYFTPGRFALVRRAFAPRGFTARVRPLHLSGFLASVFQYLVPSPALARLAERIFLGLDGFLFRAAPAVRRYAWFGVLIVRPKGRNRKGAQ